MFLKSRYNLSDKLLIERLNTDISFQIFCDVFIPAGKPLIDYKIVSRIRTKLSSKLDIHKFQKIIADSIKPHIPSNDLKVVMSDATCYESYIRFPTSQKILWESIEYINKILQDVCHAGSLKFPRTKYNDVSSAYLSFAKTRKKSHRKKRKITWRLLHLLRKLLNELSSILKSNKMTLDKRSASRYNIIYNVLEQQEELFRSGNVSNRIVSIDKPYIRPIVRGKESKSVEFGAKVNAIQVGGFNFIEHLNFNAFHEGIRVPECITLHKMLFNIKPRFFAGDAIYATNKNRTFCKENHISTNFVPKGRRPKNDKEKKKLRRELNIIRSTVLEGSFGTEKEHYSLRKIKVRTKKNEIFCILFGIHTANFFRLSERINTEKKKLLKAA